MSNFNYEFMGKAIKEKRREKEYTQEKLAEIIGVEVRTIKQWEKGALSGKINLPKLLELFSALEIDSNYLLGNSYSNKEIETVCNYTGLSEKAVKKLHRIKTDKDSVTPVLSNLLENHTEAFTGIIDNLKAYCNNIIVHQFLCNSKEQNEIVDDIKTNSLNQSSVSLMNCQQWINHIGHNAINDSYYRDSVTPFLTRIMKDNA